MLTRGKWGGHVHPSPPRGPALDGLGGDDSMVFFKIMHEFCQSRDTLRFHMNFFYKITHRYKQTNCIKDNI